MTDTKRQHIGNKATSNKYYVNGFVVFFIGSGRNRIDLGDKIQNHLGLQCLIERGVVSFQIEKSIYKTLTIFSWGSNLEFAPNSVDLYYGPPALLLENTLADVKCHASSLTQKSQIIWG